MSKKEKNIKKKKYKHTGLSINSISFVSFLMFVFVLTAGLYLGQQDPLRTLEGQRQSVADITTKNTALRFTNKVSSYALFLQGLAKDPALVNIFASKNLQALEQRADELKTVLPKVLRVRLLPVTTTQPDKSLEPHFTYACLDLLNQSLKDAADVQVEMHEIEGMQQHIDMMQAVTSRGAVVGFIQFAVDSSLLDDWTKSIAGESYLEIHQKIESGKNYLISKAGNESKQGTHATIDIPNTHWQVETWAPYQQSQSAFNSGMLFALVMGIVLSGIVAFVSRQLLHKELSNDLEKYLMLITGTLKGIKKHQFDFSLAEFKLAASQVMNVRLDQANFDREQDQEGKKSASTQSELPEMDPMFMNKDAIQLEELDDLDGFTDSAESSNEIKQAAPPANLPILPEEIFKAYDIRGVVGVTLTVENVLFIGHAIGSEAKARGLDTIVFARDGRLSGPELGKSLVTGLMTSGMKVIDIGMLPTPTLYYAAAELANGTGVMLTGSHNPANYNGIKMVLGGDTLAGDVIQSLRQRILNNDLVTSEGSYVNEQVLDKYLERITSDVKLKRKLKIVIDCGNGVAGVVAPKLFKALGCEVIELFCEVDGNFPNHHPDPSQPENLGDLIAEVKNKNADLGIAFDGDGDRIGVVSGDGKIIWPDRLMMLFAKDVLSRNPNANIIYDIKCSSNLRTVIEEYGGQPLMWKTGHSLVKAKMKETNALLAGEMSGHIFFKERWYGFDDALYSAARLLEILAASLRQPRVVFSGLPDSVNTPELKINMQEGENFKFMETLMAQSSVFTDAELTLIDGVRADYKDGWGLVRASNTTPCLVLRFEGKNKAAMAKVQEIFRKVLTDIKSDITLPF
ncbi:MAG: phosphomannomutase/phosphoglucomutase [Woeseiaceae bacterium]